MSQTLTAPFLLAACLVAPALLVSGEAAARPVMLIHGNYCGPGNNAPLPPTDALDAACARHDACTPDDGLPSQACNRRLQSEAERIAKDGYVSEDLRMMAGVVASGAAMMLSAPADRAPAMESASLDAPRHGALRRARPVAMELDAP